MVNQFTHEPKRFGLLAHPAKHSLSPSMHNAAFDFYQLPYHYHAFDIPPEQLEEALRGFKLLGIKGFNVTVPHKERIMPFLDEISEEAKQIGAVNTVINKEGKLCGYNTDGEGYVHSLLKEINLDISQTKILLLGAGGAAKGIAIFLLKHGCRSIFITNRTSARAMQLIEQLKAYAMSLEIQVEFNQIPWEEAKNTCVNADLMINTTSVGLWPNVEDSPVSLEGLDLNNKVVSDIIYNPLETTILRQAKVAGAQIHTGVGMFVYQGALAFKLFTELDPPVEVMRQAVLKHLLSHQK